MGAAMRYQPQGLARLNRGSPLVIGAQAIVTPTQRVNLATGKSLTEAGTITRTSSPLGIAFQFRKNGYVETEALPAIGTTSFVEFWYGYPSGTSGTQGDSTNPTFLTGSAANNSAIVSSIGSGRGTSNWGVLYNWGNSASTQFNNAGEVLTPGVLTLLVAVRRQSGMELWRNGQMIASFTQSPTNLSATTFLAGSFIESAFWESSNDTLLAGRIFSEWTSDQIRQFSTNPWQIFDAGSAGSTYQVATTTVGGTTDNGTLVWTEDSDSASINSLSTDRTTISWIESSDTHAVPTIFTDRATFLYTEADDSYLISSSVNGGSNTLAWTEASDTYSISTIVYDATTMVWTEASDTHSTSAFLIDRARPAWTEDNDAVSSTGVSKDFGALLWIEADDGTLFLPSSGLGGPIRRRKGIHK